LIGFAQNIMTARSSLASVVVASVIAHCCVFTGQSAEQKTKERSITNK